MPADVAEQQRRAVSPGGAAGDFGDLQTRIDLGIDRGQFAGAAQVVQKIGQRAIGHEAVL